MERIDGYAPIAEVVQARGAADGEQQLVGLQARFPLLQLVAAAEQPAQAQHGAEAGLEVGQVPGEPAAALRLCLRMAAHRLDVRQPGAGFQVREDHRAIAAHLGKWLGGISLARTARYFHRDESTIVREVGLWNRGLLGSVMF